MTIVLFIRSFLVDLSVQFQNFIDDKTNSLLKMVTLNGNLPEECKCIIDFLLFYYQRLLFLVNFLILCVKSGTNKNITYEIMRKTIIICYID